MNDSFTTVYDPYRAWMAIPETVALLILLWLGYRTFRDDVLAPWRAGETPDIGGVLGVVIVLAVWISVTSQLPTPLWPVYAGPAEVVEGPVEELRIDKKSRSHTLDCRVAGKPIHVYGEGRRAQLVKLATEPGGPIRDGQYVRVSLRAGQVLKFEVR